MSAEKCAPRNLSLQLVKNSDLRRHSYGGFDGDGSGGKTLLDSGESGASTAIPTHRRESFLYRGFDRKNLLSPSGPQLNEDNIVTPFAQIIQQLRQIRTHYCHLAGIPSSAKPIDASSPLLNKATADKLCNGCCHHNDEVVRSQSETILQQFDSCLEQLERIQTHRSVSDMATSKFKQMLNRELSQFAESGKAGNQVSEYIYNTFIDKQNDVDLGLNRRSSKNNDENKAPMSKITGLKKLVHSNSLVGQLPKFGVEVNSEEELTKILSKIDANWGIDMFKVSQISQNRPLTTVAYTIFRDRQFMKIFHIPANVLVHYLLQVEGHYRDNPYHNGIHAADVTHGCHYLLQLPALQECFSDLEMFAAVFACLVHDIDHPGFTNQFLMNTGSELALMYNDEAVLENHHLAVAFKLLQDDACDVTKSLPTKQRQVFRRMVINMVLATDMSKHMDHLAHLKTTVEARKLAGDGTLRLEDHEERLRVLQNLVHCADLSNPTKPLHLYREWTDRIMEEFFKQGDKERELSLDISPMCDRHSASVERSQVGFIDYVVQPLWETWADLVDPDCQDILDTLEDNRSWYANQISPATDDPPTTTGNDGNGSRRRSGQSTPSNTNNTGNNNNENPQSIRFNFSVTLAETDV